MKFYTIIYTTNNAYKFDMPIEDIKQAVQQAISQKKLFLELTDVNNRLCLISYNHITSISQIPENVVIVKTKTIN